MEQVLRELLNRLEQIAAAHPELYDSEVREAMGDMVLDGFIRPALGFTLPDDYRMSSVEGNRLVKGALAEYVLKANARAAALGLNTFHSRLAAFQDEKVKTASQYELSYSYFFGWLKPEEFDGQGNWQGRRTR